MKRNWWLGCLALAWLAGGQWSKLYADSQAAVTAPPAVVNPVVVQPPATTVVSPVLVQPTPPWIAVPSCPVEVEGAAPVPPNHRHSVCGWLRNRRPLCCSSAEVGCSNLAAEAVFFWGSCRAFFGEPCLKGPPPPLLHPFPVKAPPLSCP